MGCCFSTEVLSIYLPWMDGINRPANKRRIPSVLTKDEVAGVLAQMDGVPARWLLRRSDRLHHRLAQPPQHITHHLRPVLGLR